MKKLISIILLFIVLFSVVACDITSHFPNKDDNNKVPETKEQTTEYSFDDKEASPEYGGVFRTGYARVAITPSVPVGDFTKVSNDIYATCVAVYDGERTIMLVSLDIQSIMENYCDKIREKINMVCGIPTDDIFISATHNHSGPNFSSSSAPIFVKIANAAKAAVEDLADTEIFIGRGKTTGMAWVRRYVDANGNYATVSPTKPDGAWLDTNTTRSVSDADDTMQFVRFKREDKKDIIMTNWQVHLAHAVDAAPNAISSDMAHYIREGIEEGDDDALVVYFAGASGNINLNAPNNAQRKYRNYQAVAREFARIALEVMKDENLIKVNSGKINVTKKIYSARHKQDSEEEIRAARTRLKEGTGDVLHQAGDRYLVARNKSAASDLRIAAISFGDLAFITAPYEMFDNNGVQIKSGSPFKMTFILTNSDGAFAYMPSYEAWTEYGGYETWATYFDTGVAEELVGEYLNMLKSLR